MASGARVVGTLNFNVRLIEQPPFGHADVRAAQSRMARVAKGGLVDGIQDRGSGCHGARRHSSHPERTVPFLGCIPVTAEQRQLVGSRSLADTIIVISGEVGLRGGGSKRSIALHHQHHALSQSNGAGQRQSGASRRQIACCRSAERGGRGPLFAGGCGSDRSQTLRGRR